MLICLIDLACLVFGVVTIIILLTNGSMPLGNKELRGAPGYFAAALLILPLPITVMIGCAMGVNAAQQGKQDVDIDETTAVLAEVVPLALCLIPAIIIALVGAKPKKRKKKKKRRRDDDGYDDYEVSDRDVPRRRRRLDEEEDEEESRPSRRRPIDDEDADEPPPRRRYADDDDEDRPRRRRRDEDD